MPWTQLLKMPDNWSITRLILLLMLLLTACEFDHATAPPYRSSTTIKNIVFDWSTHQRHATGSDNWPLTWADDDNQYTSWGDGGGFGGTNSKGRVSLGVARIEGNAASYKGFNIWGGHNEENSSTFKGKSYGISCIDGKLYMWVSPGSGKHGYDHSQLYLSTNHGASWSSTNVKFTRLDGVIHPTFLQFGRDYSRVLDDYVYIYANRFKDDSEATLQVQKPGEIVLMRVQRNSITEQSAYTFFGGISGDDMPVWLPDLSASKPVFHDPNGVGWATGGVIYNPDLKRYLLTTEHTATGKGNLGIFDAPEPWGPWTTVEYMHNFGVPHIENSTFYWNFSGKWFRNNGKSFTLVFSGTGQNDAWNSVSGSFITD
ncbi:MAG: DUF4185 domain-containing protein [Gammaproteobacteria bacterium]|nr:DUF4185 domain-containing protein [Gammaproteobacteria bacterium]